MEFTPLFRKSRGAVRAGVLFALLSGLTSLLAFSPAPQAQVARQVNYQRLNEEPVAPSTVNVRNLIRRFGATVGGRNAGDARGLATSSSLQAAATGAVTLSFDTAQDAGAFEPPDNGLAVGPNHIVSAYNIAWGVWDKRTGRRLFLTPFATWYQGLDDTGNITHPRVEYDARTQRWYLMTVGRSTANPKATLQISVSATSDPLGAWYRYVFDVTESDPAKWLDDPTFGYNDLAFFVAGSAYTFGATPAFQHVTLRTFSKALMLAGATVQPITLTNLGSGLTPAIQPTSVQPVISRDSTNVQWMVDASSGNSLGLWRVTNPLSNTPLVTYTSISVPGYAAPPAMTQQDPAAAALHGGDTRIANAILLDGRIWCTHGSGIDVAGTNRAEVRVYELAATGAGALVQSYAISDQNLNLHFPSLDIDGFGAVLVGFNTSGANQFVGVSFAVKAEDETQFGAPQVLKAGSFDYTPRNAANAGLTWGEYSDTQYDPANPGLVWHQGELAASTTTWKLTVGAIASTPKKLTVTSPNGGEVVLNGGSHTITWRSAGFVTPGNVRLELSRDGGETFPELISADTPDDGSFDWIATGPVSTLCRVRITSLVDVTVTDDSDADFSIVDGVLQVDTPNGGEVAITGTVLPITWTASGFANSLNNPTVRIELSRDAGTTWTVLFASTANDGSEDWTVTSPLTEEAIVRVTANAFPVFTDESDDVFEIREPSTLTVTYPNGGEQLVDGREIAIQWETTGLVTDVRVELSRNGGITWETLFPSTPNETNEPNRGEVFWTVRGPFTRLARIRVTDLHDPTASDTSNGVFDIQVPSLRVTSPTEGQRALVDEETTITWTSNGLDENSDVVVELSRDGGDTWEEIAYTTNTGFIDWQVEGEETTNAVIRVTSEEIAGVFALSRPFSILEPTMSLTSPNGRDGWRVGRQEIITWSGTTLGQGRVDIQLNRNYPRGAWETIIRNSPNDGGQAWGVRGKQSKRARVRIIWSSDTGGEVEDESDANFRILKALRGKRR